MQRGAGEIWLDADKSGQGGGPRGVTFGHIFADLYG